MMGELGDESDLMTSCKSWRGGDTPVNMGQGQCLIFMELLQVDATGSMLELAGTCRQV